MELSNSSGSKEDSHAVMEKPRGNLVIGVTGYTGCGKSFICKLLQRRIENEWKLTCKILDADVMARYLRDENGIGKKRIIEVLGEEVYSKEDGKSIPSKINAIIFDEKQILKRRQYEAIFQEIIPHQVREHITNAPPNSTVFILDFFMIFVYLRSILDLIDFFVLITCSKEKQLLRLTESKYGRNVERELALKRINNQRIAEPEELISKSVQFIVKNEEDTEDTNNQISKLLDLLQLKREEKSVITFRSINSNI